MHMATILDLCVWKEMPAILKSLAYFIHSEVKRPMYEPSLKKILVQA